jgi:hypothetical protein
MSVSSVTAAPPPPVQPIQTSPPKAPDQQPDADANNTSTQPTIQAPLPPGQGTRVDQLV